jgi:hypothetical protein
MGDLRTKRHDFVHAKAHSGAMQYQLGIIVPPWLNDMSIRGHYSSSDHEPGS